MMMTECLNAEHGVFLSQLAYLEELLGRNASPETLAVAVQCLGRAVGIHRDGEEKLLYPAIDRACGPGFPPLAVMEHEHREIERAIEQARRGSIDTPTVCAFLGTLREHIAKEIRILFPIAEERLGAERLKDMTRQYVDLAHETAGIGRTPCG